MYGATARFAVVATILLAACDWPATAPEGLSFRADASQAGVTDTVVATLDNGSTQSVQGLLCPVSIERMLFGRWTHAYDAHWCRYTNDLALMGFRVLPGSQLRLPVALPQEIKPGTYRLVMRLTYDNSPEHRLATNSFAITR